MKDLDTRQSEKGLSLLEIAIALIVVGLLVTPLLQMYNINKMERVSRENNKTLENIAIALNKYAQQNKKYPVPANPTLTAADASYGSSAAIAPSVACNGVITGQGVRCTIGATNNASPANEVLIGTVPFLELGLNDKDTFDIYGSKITYAVTRRLTNKTTFNDKEGAIGLVNQNGTPLDGGGDFNVLDSSGKPHVLFALINHGANRSGAYQKDGSLAPCSGQLDTDNCNRDPSIANGPSTIDGSFRGRQKYDPANAPNGLLPELSKSFALGTGTGFYDDTVTFRTTSRDEGWSSLRSDVSDTEAGTFLSESGKVMIKKDPSESTTAVASMDVDGAVQVYKTTSPTVCNRMDVNPSTDDCFKIKNIASKEPDPTELAGGIDKAIKCDDMGGLKGMSKAKKDPQSREQNDYYIKRRCPATESPMPATTCPTDKGISKIVNGEPQCS